jgi:hypothetical protein
LGLPVIITQTAVFGDLGVAGCVDHPQVGPDNDIWHSRVFGRITEAKGRESLPIDDVLDP